MIKNYLKTAWRNLLRNKLHGFINIGGLAVGMAVSFMLLLYVFNELSFDHFNTNGSRLYKVMKNQPGNGELLTGSATPVPLAPVLLKDFPEVEQAARTSWTDNTLMIYNGKGLKVNTMGADPALLEMFSFDFLKGSRGRALSDPSSIVLTASAAKALFGNADPIGKVVKLNNRYPLKVSALLADNPQNSSFTFAALISWQALEAQQLWIKQSGWGNYSFSTYVLLKPGVSVPALNARLKGVIGQHDPQNKENELFLFPFTRLHLYSDFKNGINTGGSIEYVRLFLLLAIGILLIACINFMNLSTARSERRAREVGVRKAVGGRRWVLIQQFMGESLLMAFMALVLAFVLLLLLLPLFNAIIHIQLHFPFGNGWAWLAVLGTTVITGLVAGSYPAVFLSSFNPVKVLKGQIISPKSTVRPRQVLVVVQFTFAICLILSSLFIYRQLNYIKNRPLGYNRSGLVEIYSEGSLTAKFERFRQDAIQAGAVTDAALTSSTITNNNSNSWGITWPGQLPGEDKIPIDQIGVTYHFISTYGLSLTEGRDFEQGRPADSTAVILNEAAVKMMRFKQPIGQRVKWQDVQCTVIGVVENFVWGSPFEPVQPAIIGFKKDWTGVVGLRLNPNVPVSKSLSVLEGVYKKYNPEYPFDYRFTDEDFSKKFKTEQLLGTMAASFTTLAIIISCLGLFGLASFSAEQRRKEIGIRKVLGASTHNLWFRLSQEFVQLVLISFVIGALISWYNVQQWLARYTYHATLSIWVFAGTLVCSLLICLLTVSWQAIKAAWTNPVVSLRSE